MVKAAACNPAFRSSILLRVSLSRSSHRSVVLETAMTNYKLKIQLDLNMPFKDDAISRSKAKVLVAAIEKLIADNCNTPRPSIEKVTLIDQDRRDGTNILSNLNAEIRQNL